MHLADVLSPATAVGTGLAAAGAVAVGLRRVGQNEAERLVPLMGVMSAGVFAAQMVNFPILPGTSGHLMGAALATLVLGPWAAMLAMTVVVAAQCLLFYDGGLTALGANVLNMAVGGCLAAHVANTLVRRMVAGSAGQVAGAVAAAWFSVVVSSGLCAAELAASDVAPLKLVLPAMLLVHGVIGAGEAWITGSVVAFLLRVQPGMLEQVDPGPGARRWKVAVSGLAAALLVAFFLSPLASAAPDGLEFVAARLGFDAAEGIQPGVPMPDYRVRGMRHGWLTTSLAGAAGVLSVFGVAWLIGRTARPAAAVKTAEDDLALLS